jgi:hypothetical protein
VSVLLLWLRLHLCLLLAVAVAGKLLDLPGARAALVAFGCPSGLVSPALVALLLTEAVLSVGLVSVATSRLAALGGLCLFLLFSVAMLRLLRQGKRPHCHCFGVLHSAPISYASVGRNLSLALCCLPLALAVDQGKPLGRLSDVEVLVLALNASVYVAAGVGYALLNKILEMQTSTRIRLEELRAQIPGAPRAAVPDAGLPVGSPAPDFRLPVAGSEETVSLSELLRPGRNLALLFVDPNCIACAATVESIVIAQESELVLISSGSEVANRKKFGDRYRVLLQNARETADVYRANWSPSLQMVGSDGTVAAPLSIGTESILKLAREMPVRQPFPQVDLRRVLDLQGEPVRPDSLAERSLLLYWNPQCSWCEKMLPELQRWAQLPATQRVGLILLVSQPSPELAEVGADSVWVDPSDLLAQQLKLLGTPSGVLLDGARRVASEVAAGSERVWMLVGPF